MTLTIETLNDFIAGKGFGVAPSAVEAMARELLANREAQPVAYLNKFSGVCMTLEQQPNAADDVAVYSPLYTAPPAPAVPDDYQHLKNVRELYHKQEDRLFSIAQRIKGEAFDKYSHVPSQAIDVLERAILGDDGDACRAAMLAQPVSSGYKLPEGWKLVPVEPTKEMINAALASGAISIRTAYSAMLAAAPEGGNDHDTRR